MTALWIFVGGITLYVIGSFLEWLGNQMHGGRR